MSRPRVIRTFPRRCGFVLTPYPTHASFRAAHSEFPLAIACARCRRPGNFRRSRGSLCWRARSNRHRCHDPDPSMGDDERRRFGGARSSGNRRHRSSRWPCCQKAPGAPVPTERRSPKRREPALIRRRARPIFHGRGTLCGRAVVTNAPTGVRRYPHHRSGSPCGELDRARQGFLRTSAPERGYE